MLPEGRSLPGRQAALRRQRPPGREPALHGPGAGGGPGGPGLAPGPGAGGRAAGGGRPERARRPLRPPAPGRLPGRGPPAGALHHDAGRHDRPLRRGLRLRRPHRHRLRDQGRPLHRPPLRGIRLGDGQAARGARMGRRHRASTWPTATPAATASSTCRCSRASARPHAVNPDPSLTVVATARRWPVEHWDRPPGVPSVVGLEPYHLLRPFVRKLSFPYARFDIAGRRERADTGPGPAGVEPPELLRRGRAGPRRPRDRAARALPRQEGDLRRAGGRARSPGPSAASRSTGAAARASRCARPRRH